MPASVICPICGADGTVTANEIIAFRRASELIGKKDGPDKVMALVVVGCLLAGIAGVIKALSMTGGVDVLLCLLGATFVFGTALAVYFWKRE